MAVAVCSETFWCVLGFLTRVPLTYLRKIDLRTSQHNGRPALGPCWEIAIKMLMKALLHYFYIIPDTLILHRLIPSMLNCLNALWLYGFFSGHRERKSTTRSLSRSPSNYDKELKTLIRIS